MQNHRAPDGSYLAEQPQDEYEIDISDEDVDSNLSFLTEADASLGSFPAFAAGRGYTAYQPPPPVEAAAAGRGANRQDSTRL